jgi:hypothetical protein
VLFSCLENMHNDPSSFAAMTNPFQGLSGPLPTALPTYRSNMLAVTIIVAIKRIRVMPETG